MTKAAKPYLRVAIWIFEDGQFGVTGYRQGGFHAEGKFRTIGESLAKALSLPVKDDSHPINIVRRGA